MDQATAIIAAGGAGLRMGQPLPKQFCALAGTPILVHTIRAFLQVALIREIIVVAPAEHLKTTEALLTEHDLAGRCLLVAGGVLRQDSVRIGLAHTSPDSTLVAVHDGARPLINPAHISACLAVAAQHGAAIVAVPVKDTLKRVDNNGRVLATVAREELWQAQTPQAARTEILRSAYEKADAAGFIGTDEASLFEYGGFPVSVVEGSETNLKITRPDDLLIAEALLMQTPVPQQAAMRIGHGYDAHCLTEGRKLILGGVTIPHEMGLLGHSDADVVCHALCDAILGAIGQGDIGRHFPDTDPQYKGISSIKLLTHVANLARKQGFSLGNADVTIVAQRPKLLPFFAEMQKNMAAACQVEPGRINVKGTTTENMGFTGRQEGISTHAVALLTPDPL